VTSSAPGVSVVICAYTEDRWSDLLAAVASVRGQDPAPDEIIVVTDHNDALLARARAAIPEARVVPNAEAKGLSGARNTGIAVSSGAVVAFLDDDAVAEPGWVRHLLEPYADPRVLGVGGRVVPRWDEDRPAWLPSEFDWVVGCTYAGHRDEAGPVRNVIGANMSVRRDVVAKIGGFRHSLGRTASLPAGCEETEFFIRAAQHFPRGIVWFEPAAAVSHRVPAARATAKYFRTRCFAEGISKTQISRLVGTADGLASERAYTMRALPRAVRRELSLAIRTLDPAGVARAATVVTGVAATAGGYAAARVPGSLRWLPSRNRGATPPGRPADELSSGFEPALVAQIDLADGVQPLSALDPRTGATYKRAVVLVRDHGAPVGIVRVELGPYGLSADELTSEIRGALGVDVPAAPVPATPVIRDRALLPRISVVIATRDRTESLRRCVESLQRLDHGAAEIVVVDNASAGRETADLVRELAIDDPRVKYVREDRPGLARAHNCGLEHVTAPYVAFTDDDVVVDPAWLDGLLAGFARDARVACVTGMIFPLELETPAQDWLEHYAGFNKGFAPQVFDARRGSTDPLFPYTAGRFGSGANMAFRTEVLIAMQGFEPALGAGTEAKGGDDLAAFFDVIAAGHAIAYEPEAIVYHQHHRTFEALRRQTFGYGAGLTAYLTKTVVDEPRRVLDMLAKAPRAARHALSPSSTKNDRLPGDTPRVLVRRERLGMLVGPALYFLSRWDTRLDERLSASEPVVAIETAASGGPVAGARQPEVAAPDIDLVELELREARVAP
jgi:glycosyltransferase involved in cell wall biosynthesis